jgi:hypothetical protein
MGGKAGISISLVVLALIAAVATGCGGSSSGATGGSTGSGKSGSTTSSGSESTGGSEGANGSKAPAPGFSKKAEKAGFGEESDAAEREAASQILEENLQARASGDFAKQCETLSGLAVSGIEQNSNRGGGKKKDCAETLESESAKAPPGLLENTMTEPIAALRIKGPIAYALYHGKGGKDYSMKMDLENGEWKVAALLTEEVP